MIVAVAIEESGVIYSLPRPNRHHHVIEKMVEEGVPTPIRGNQGFIDDELGFLGRRQAFERARDTGQLPETTSQPDVLFSEDIW